MVQEGLLQLRQGMGRLIRRQRDCGAVVVLDRRVVGHYSRQFASSNPWSFRYDNLGVIGNYFADKRREA